MSPSHGASDKKPQQPSVLCPHCGGRKKVSVGTDMVPCATCNATGKVRERAQKQDS